MRGPVTSSTTSSPTAQWSPIRAASTSSPRMVRFSPNEPLAITRSRRTLPGVHLLAGEGIDSLAVAAVVAGVTDEVADEPAAQPATLGPVARSVATSTGRFPMPVIPTFLAGLGSALPRLTERTCPRTRRA